MIPRKSIEEFVGKTARIYVLLQEMDRGGGWIFKMVDGMRGRQSLLARELQECIVQGIDPEQKTMKHISHLLDDTVSVARIVANQYVYKDGVLEQSIEENIEEVQTLLAELRLLEAQFDDELAHRYTLSASASDS